MTRNYFILYLKALLVAGVIGSAAIAISQKDQTFRQTLLDYIDTHSQKEEEKTSVRGEEPIQLPELDSGPYPFSYYSGDWEKYVLSPRYQLIIEDINKGLYRLEEEKDVNIHSYGAMRLSLLYGKSEFTKSKYKLHDEDKPVSKVIPIGFSPEHEVQLHIEGHVGKRLTIYIDHDSRREDNKYVMKYRAVDDEEVIREINAGQIDIKVNNSKYAIYDGTSSKGVGMDLTMQKNKFRLKAFGSVLQGETVVEIFRGNSSPGNAALAEYQFVRNTYYQLEPFKRYDGLSDTGDIPADPYTLVTFTSDPVSPETYTPGIVNIDASGFTLYLDDQDPHNNYNTIKLSVDSGQYAKMVSGVDYIINYATGLITIKKVIPDNARIFALYTVNGGSLVTTDPTARTDVFSGMLFVFIKYGYSINEDLNENYVRDGNESDRNNDGELNLDMYEVRSFYRLGEMQLKSDNFKLQFYKENGIMSKDDVKTLGKSSVDYAMGLVYFNLREPFKKLLGNNSANLYSEKKSSNAFLYSLYKIKVDYYRKARSFQLKHFNIISESVRIKVNRREIPKSLYSIDYTGGFLRFTDPNSPIITNETEIEVKYEYLPFGGGEKSFTGGFRGDYQLNRAINLGGTLLFSRTSAEEAIPLVGNEPEQLLVLEGDTKLALSRGRLKKLANTIPGVSVDSVPFEVTAYAEYAKSYKKINTFGKALIDDMETTNEVVSVSLSDKDWILSSMPSGKVQSDRGLARYYYYRDLSNSDSLRGLDFSPYTVSYSKKPGPYNVATGHVSSGIISKNEQRSLVFDFDFSSGGDTVAVANQRLSSDAVDFSSLQYIELWYRSEGGSGEVELAVDLGKIDEDSDGDSLLDTEDKNNNGFLDSDPDSNNFEDRGYRFNPSGSTSTWVGSGPQLSSFTMGDGTLNSEDLNGNGTLDSIDQVVTFPGSLSTPSTSLVIELSDTKWKKLRIYLDKTSALYTANPSYYEALLSQVEALRIYLTKVDTTNKGTVFIDGLRFVSSRWKDIKIDDISLFDPNKFQVAIVDTYNDSDYRKNAFLFKQRETYTSLHGNKSTTELKREQESALSITYNVSANTKGSVTRRFMKKMDLRFYKTLNIWFNFREFVNGDRVGIRLGSSESDYIEYKFDMKYRGIWKEIKLMLRGGSSGVKNISKIVGNPDMKRIYIMEIAVYGDSGEFWVNDIYVSEPVTLKDSAYWFETEILSKRPVARTRSGVPIISDIRINYIEKGHGAQFNTIGQTVHDVKEHYRELFTSMNILPYWSARFDVTMEESETDSLNEDVSASKRGTTDKRSIYFETFYRSPDNAIPSVKVVLKRDDYRNLKEEYVSLDSVFCETKDKIITPALMVEEKVDDFAGGNLVARVLLDSYFKDEKITREPEDKDFDLEQILSLKEEERRQKGKTQMSIDYRNKIFYLRPSLEFGSHEIVELQGKSELSDTEILTDVSGRYHFPFKYDDDNFRFVDRNKRGDFLIGFTDLPAVSPSMKIDLSYSENKFRDYDETERSSAREYTRAKDARSSIAHNLDLPILLGKYKNLKWIRALNFNYTRTLYFTENEIPYEGEETSSFDEEYGINRVYEGFNDAGLNIFKYPPWHFFSGRDTSARGRDYTHGKFNEPLYYEDDSQVANYNNSLRLIDTFSWSSAVDIVICSLNYGGGINQISERQTIEGIPQQVVTLNHDVHLNFDMMRIFSFSFFRPNRSGLAHHAANLNIGYGFRRNKLITSNIEENVHSPSLGITFKRDRASLGLRGSLDFRRRNDKEYISLDESKRSRHDDIYIENMQEQVPFKETDKGYKYSIFFETDVLWIYRLFMKLYPLAAYPIFSIEYAILINRYDYTVTVSPEPYDQHLVTGKLTLDLHKNIQGGIQGRWALEKFRNRDTNNVYREIRSYEIGLLFTLLF